MSASVGVPSRRGRANDKAVGTHFVQEVSHGEVLVNGLALLCRIVQGAAAVKGRQPQAAGLEHGLEVVRTAGELGDDRAEGLGAGVSETADIVDRLDEIVAPSDLVAGTAKNGHRTTSQCAGAEERRPRRGEPTPCGAVGQLGWVSGRGSGAFGCSEERGGRRLCAVCVEDGLLG